jgi:hypothetical protein
LIKRNQEMDAKKEEKNGSPYLQGGCFELASGRELMTIHFIQI